MKDAQLPGYQIFRVKDAFYPGIVRIEADIPCCVPGKVVLEVDQETRARLDAYEGDFYEAHDVEVSLPESNESVHADVYAIPKYRCSEILSHEPWTLSWFEKEGLTDYWERMNQAGY